MRKLAVTRVCSYLELEKHPRMFVERAVRRWCTCWTTSYAKFEQKFLIKMMIKKPQIGRSTFLSHLKKNIFNDK